MVVFIDWHLVIHYRSLEPARRNVENNEFHIVETSESVSVKRLQKSDSGEQQEALCIVKIAGRSTS